LASNLSFVEAAEQTLAGPGLDPGIVVRPLAVAGMATVLEDTVPVMAEVVVEERTSLTRLGAECLLEGAVGFVVEALMVANTVVQPVQEHSDLEERLLLVAGCTVMDLELLWAEEVLVRIVGLAVAVVVHMCCWLRRTSLIVLG
jgi:hypothetical protein